MDGGAQPTDRSLKAADYFDQRLAARKLRLKPRSYETDEEAVRLYWRPGLGHLRLADVRDRHIQDVIAAMMLINQDVPDDLDPAVSEILRRLIAVRADDERRVLPEGETRRKKSTRPLSPSRIERMYATLRGMLNEAVKHKKLQASPCEGVELPRADHTKPLAWTPQREAKFRKDLAKRTAAAEEQVLEGRVLSEDEYRAIWASSGLRPVPSMVWLPDHAGVFLDYLEETGERLAPLFIAAVFCGFRRSEVLGLTWSEVDLDAGGAFVRTTASGDDPKSEAGKRFVPFSGFVIDVLKAWRKIQVADRLAWGEDWPDTDLVFTREDGSPVPGQWASVRFQILAYRSGLPPVRFHDLRHGTASLMKAAKQDTKLISATLGHSRTSFTDSQYVSLFPAVQREAADAATAVVPRRRRASGDR